MLKFLEPPVTIIPKRLPAKRKKLVQFFSQNWSLFKEWEKTSQLDVCFSTTEAYPKPCETFKVELCGIYN